MEGQMDLHILIIEDDIAACKELRQYIEKIQSGEVEGRRTFIGEL